MKGIQIISSAFHFPRHTSRFNPTNQLSCYCYCSSVTMNSGGNSNKPDDNSHIAGTWFSVPELRLRDHRFTVPLDYSVNDHHQHQISSSVISVFAREVVSAGKEEQQLPYLLYLQGGPGFESPRPNEASGWIKKACEEYRVILLDQRGTGLSTPLTISSLSQFASVEKLVDYLKHFRADNIVNDAEFIRVRLVPNAEPWTILGQSYGGFCAVTYLSFAPQGLKQALLTGGLPPIGKGSTADSVYRACFEQLTLQNEKYYKRYPQDIEIVREVVKYLAESEGGGVPLPSGGILTPRGLQTVGLSGLGLSTGFERMHYMFERVWDPILVPGSKKSISYFFLKSFDDWMAFDKNPLYALLHESIYCQVTFIIIFHFSLQVSSNFCVTDLALSPLKFPEITHSLSTLNIKGAPSKWAAHRIRSEQGSKFDAVKAAKEGRPVMFTGEMIFPWMFDEVHALRHFKDAAHLLAEKDWPSSLYNVTALKNNKVPVAAAVYHDDMFVNFKLAMETSSQISGIRLWITNEFMHSGLRDGSDQVLDTLFGMLIGKKPLF